MRTANVEPRTSNVEPSNLEPRTSLHCDDLYVPFAPYDGDAQIMGMPLQLQIDLRVADGEIGEANPVDRLGQLSARERNAARRCVDVNAERGAEEHEDGSCRPRLWCARDGIE